MSDNSTPVLTDKERRSRLIETIKNAYKAGLAIVPPRNDGSKRPLPNSWKEFQSSRPTKEQLKEWYGPEVTGVGFVCGDVSGNLEAMDFDVQEIYDDFREAAEQSGLLPLLERIENGYMEKSPSGVHILYRCAEVGRNMKLATRPKRPEEMKDENDKTKTLIETRGEGGYIIAAPSYGNVHPSGGEYTMDSGGPETIVEITPEEHDDLHALASTFHISPEEKVKAEADRASQETKQAGRPGDDFNNRAEWLDVLVGWTFAYHKNGTTYLRKPGSSEGVHATINAYGTDRFYCFTTGTEFEQRFYDKFSAYAVLNHGGDFTAAAKDLAAKGYGNGGNTCNTVNSIEDVVWDEPMKFGEMKTPEIPTNLLPGIYGKYADSVSKATQTPSGMAAMFMLSVLATCLQGKAVVAPKPGYHEPLMVWTLSALPPASRKTAVMQHLMAPLTRWEAEKVAELHDRIAEAKMQRDVIERRMEKLKQQAGKTESEEERAELMHQLRELTGEIPDEVTPVRLYSGDANTEGLQKLLVENNGRMSVLTDEGAIFEVMGGMYSNGKVNINVFLQGHAGSPVRVDRAGRSVTINSPCLTFGLVVQPDVVAKLSSNSKSTFRGNGCLGRFIFCVPESNIGKRDIRKQPDIDPSLKAQYIDSTKSLLDLPMPNADDSNVPTITLDRDALNMWQDFAQWIEGELGPSGSMESIQDWGGKLAGATLRIAGLFHVAEFGIGSKPISAVTMQNAIKLAELLIDHAKAAFDMMDADKETTDAKYLLQRILNNREECFNRNQLHKQVHGKFTKVDKLEAALAVLIDRNLISEPVKKHTGRRPEILHYVNPKVWEMV